MSVYQATVSAPVNIACIKCEFPLLSHILSYASTRYWGKRDTRLILPTNSSLSVTLDQDHLQSTTTSRADPSFDKDRLWLNGKEETIEPVGRLTTCITEMKRLRAAVEAKDPSAPKVCTQFSVRFRPVSSHPTSLRPRSCLPSRYISLPATISPPQPALHLPPQVLPPLLLHSLPSMNSQRHRPSFLS